jgi:aquaglyceroporin related protein
MLGTMVLILFGNGVDCQVVLGGSSKVVSAAKGDYLSLNFGWAIGKRRIPQRLGGRS